jgi:GH15 family glucan-1,4-alpha-glucosidase
MFPRVDGFAPLGRYGFLGDNHAGALVAADGAVDWFAPRMDGPPVCAALLDPEAGGSVTLRPTVPYDAEQRYLPATMVLETTFRCAGSVVRVTDSLNRATGGPLPWAELARRVEVTGEPVPMRWTVQPGHLLGTGRPWLEERDGIPLVHAGPVLVATVTDGIGTPEVHGSSLRGRFTARSGETGLLAVVATETQPLTIPDPPTVQHRIDRTIDFWRHWCDEVGFGGPNHDAVRRCALVLRAVWLSPYDGLLAALTTSLPERRGGDRNFDYRFGWVRDASFTLDAMSELDLTQEVEAALTWLLRAVRTTTPQVRPLYTLQGHVASADTDELDHLPGYRGSLPVRVGNAAADQQQLGSCGDLLDAVWRFCHRHGVLDPDNAVALAGVVDMICDVWRSKDSGIWELPEQAHYTISKIGCWVALDRGVRLAEAGHLTTAQLVRWRAERDAVHEWVDDHCWSAAKRSYTIHAGTDELDAAVLLAARTGFLAGDDPRLSSTIDAIRAELTAKGPLLYRCSGMVGQEGAFVACTFWMVEALALAGRRREAEELMQEALEYAGETGIFSEEIDPTSGELLGNLPQGLSHLALIGAAKALRSRA